jgi:hypothetical protein
LWQTAFLSSQIENASKEVYSLPNTVKRYLVLCMHEGNEDDDANAFLWQTAFLSSQIENASKEEE